ncbi:Swt1 family HEPN domain-containing protein [Micrococcus luteus]|uniref:Swt1 family HEPN domain-containing protein n=1 Tax=Micrococcus luteus TaxID=1270 RepID=UPI0021CCFE4D|nr:Swt1 family HEPN domain-containing protein [Micrococcus luteus]
MMATSNREHVDRALSILAGVLDPFITKVLVPKLPAGTKDWTVVLAAKDAQNGHTGKIYERTDPQSQFRVITESFPTLGHPFNGVLSRTEQGYAGELREVRNGVAHNRSFTADQARRALETVELLLRAVGAAPEADRVRLIRREIERAEFEKETRQATRAHSTQVRTDDTGLRPWREVLRPHPDVRSGDFASSEFAADLYRVAVKDTRGTADEPPTEYTDAVEFFRRTYLTEGLRELLQRAAARLAGDRNADAVINLQTTFGGGKTHSMLAVWHLFSGRPLHEFPRTSKTSWRAITRRPSGRLSAG